MSRFVVSPASVATGRVKVPGDKSISHRALMLGAIANGETHVTGFLPGEDCRATLAAVRAMGVRVVEHDATTLSVFGRGLSSLRAPLQPLDMGNSGTAMRLFAGLLAGQPFDTVLIGDESLSRRPMERVAVPLRLMGADIETTGGRPPVRVRGSRGLRGIRYEMPVASAQVKSALLLAGLYASGSTTVVEPAITRDHTERMLLALGVEVRREGLTTTLVGGQDLRATRIDVPGDLSSAAFLLLAGCLSGSGEVAVENVGLNPSRSGVLDILRLMGADVSVSLSRDGRGEPAGTLTARPSRLRGCVIPAELVPLAIDEFPLVFVAAALAEGRTVVSGAAELRQKESDRIAVMAAGLRGLGIAVDETADGAVITGGALRAGTIDSRGDHRVAMSFAIGAMRAAGPIEILDTRNVATSFPGFGGKVRELGLALDERDG